MMGNAMRSRDAEFASTRASVAVVAVVAVVAQWSSVAHMPA
jgi:hypothetical protein